MLMDKGIIDLGEINLNAFSNILSKFQILFYIILAICLGLLTTINIKLGISIPIFIISILMVIWKKESIILLICFTLPFLDQYLTSFLIILALICYLPKIKFVNKVAILYGIYILIKVISILINQTSMQFIFEDIIYLLAFCLFYSVANKEKVIKYVLYGLASFIFVSLWFFQGLGVYSANPFIILGSSNFFAAYITLTLPLSIGMYINSQKKVVPLIVILLQIIALFQSYSRVALVLSFVYFIFTFIKYRRYILSFFISMTCYLLNKYIEVSEHATNISIIDDPRYLIYKWTIQNINLNNIVLGIGPGNFQHWFYTKVGTVTYNGLMPVHPHNFFLWILTESGLIALLIMLILLAMGILKKTNGHYMYTALKYSLLLFVLLNIIDNSYYNSRVAFLFWIMLALIEKHSLNKEKINENIKN